MLTPHVCLRCATHQPCQVCIVGLTECDAADPDVVTGLIEVGLTCRKTGSWLAWPAAHVNFDSSLMQLQLPLSHVPS